MSPHIAAARATRVCDGFSATRHALANFKQIPPDDEIVRGIHNVLTTWERDGLSHAFVETAGGVQSPGPSGTSQADLYRALRLPVVLVADFHLGGISSSISAYESLLVRGYDVESVIMFDDAYYQNSDYLRDFFLGKDIPLLALTKPPERRTGDCQHSIGLDGEAMEDYYAATASGIELQHMMSDLESRHEKRLRELESMASRAHRSLWYPFTQHSGLEAQALTVIDSAKGDHFQVFQPDGDASSAVLGPVFDGSASWWTQGLGHGNPQLALGAAYAAGRYGHVMFALGAHEPAIDLADLMLRNTRNERLSRVFYSDNGSTAMEVAVKMALRASCHRYAWDASQEEIGIIGLKGSYHGDTIGTMDCSEPSTFNEKVEWYRGRGYWFDFPQAKMVRGEWTIEMPEVMLAGGPMSKKRTTFGTLNEIFDISAREDSDLGHHYKQFVRATMRDLVLTEGRKFGALILEPIVLGAGGMLLVDPLFQHILIRTIRSEPDLAAASTPSVEVASPSWSGLPVIFDEVFTGLYRLYHFSPSHLFPQSSRPDISAHAKLLTGGLLPLAMTLASEEIFGVFNSSPAKEQALLHGHSYTAHPVGCHVAKLSVQTMLKMEEDGAWGQCTTTGAGDDVWSIWPESLLVELSRASSIDSVWALGTVLTIVLRDESGGGELIALAILFWRGLSLT